MYINICGFIISIQDPYQLNYIVQMERSSSRPPGGSSDEATDLARSIP